MQAALQFITHNLPWFISEPAAAILGDSCYTVLVYNADLSSHVCLRLALSKALGLGIVVFGSILKVPQIIKIVKARSAKGVSLTMYSLEVVAYTISLAYAWRLRIPFSTYGENASLTLQNMIITLLIIAYAQALPNIPFLSPNHETFSSRRRPLIIAALVMIVGSIALASPSIVSPPFIALLQALTIPISLASKVPQMLELNRSRAPGQLSAVVVFAQLAGTIARVFTTLTETGDSLLLWGFALATGFNFVLAVQYIWYWNGNTASDSLKTTAAKKERETQTSDVPAMLSTVSVQPPRRTSGRKLD